MYEATFQVGQVGGAQVPNSGERMDRDSEFSIIGPTCKAVSARATCTKSVAELVTCEAMRQVKEVVAPVTDCR